MASKLVSLNAKGLRVRCKLLRCNCFFAVDVATIEETHVFASSMLVCLVILLFI